MSNENNGPHDGQNGNTMNKARRPQVANPHEKGFGTTAYLFRFGVMGCTNVIAYAYSVDDALEAAADHLVERGYLGHITPHDAPQGDLCCDCDDPFDCDSHTYTEAGWLTSYEWTFCEFDRAEAIAEFSDKPERPLRGIGHLGY